MKQLDLIVIGGGVSGLTLAARAATAGLATLLLEREPRLGGCLKSWRVSDDFWLEQGAHTAYNSYRNLLEILEERGRLGELAPRAKMGYQFLDGGRVQSPLARLNFLELLTHLPFGLRREQAGASLAEYYGALFGAGNYARLLSPAFAAVLSQPADSFPAAWLFRRKPRLKSAPRKYTWPGGLQGLAEALAEGAAFETRRDEAASALARVDGGYEVRAGDARYSARLLALATPPDEAARLLGGLDDAQSRELAGLLGQFPMADIESLSVVLPSARVRLKPLAGLIGINEPFYSVVSRDPVFHPSLRGFTFHFRPGRLDRAGKLECAARVLGAAQSEFRQVAETINRLPALDTRHPPLAEELDRRLAGAPLALAGNYFIGMSIGDCADRAAREAARLLQV